MTDERDNSSFKLIRLFNNLKKALDIQASSDAKIEPIVDNTIPTSPQPKGTIKNDSVDKK